MKFFTLCSNSLASTLEERLLYFHDPGPLFNTPFKGGCVMTYVEPEWAQGTGPEPKANK